MIETLYKTDCPEKGKSECYVLVVTPRPASRERCYSFMEEHGRWDETMGRFIYEVKQIVTDEELTYENAVTMYNASKKDLLNKGFVHSIVQGCLRKEPSAYELFQFECATA
jgi:hypothetical protein